MKRVAWFVLFLVLGVSCLDQPDCFRQNVNLIGISFKKMFDGKADTVALLQVTTGDTVLYSKVRGTSFSLPLNFLANQTDFYLEILEKDYLSDVIKPCSLKFTHKSQAQFVSEDCGTRFIVSGLNLLDSDPLYAFDSIKQVSSSPGNIAHVNIVVYRCPRTNIMRLSFRQLYMDVNDTLSRGKLDSRAIESLATSGVPLLEDTTLSAVLLPVNPNATSSQYSFKFSNGDENTVSFNYQIDPKTIIEKCGPQQVYSQLDSVDNTFKILKIQKDSLQDPPATNVETFRCAITNEVKVLFKQNRGSSRVTDTLHILSITNDYSSEMTYVDSATTTVTLKLNPSSDVKSTKFTFQVEENNVTQTKILQFDYTAKSVRYHQICGFQTTYSDLKLNTATDFVGANVLLTDVKFPAINNLEIVK